MIARTAISTSKARECGALGRDFLSIKFTNVPAEALIKEIDDCPDSGRSTNTLVCQ